MTKVPAYIWCHFIVAAVQENNADIPFWKRLGCHKRSWQRWLKGEPIGRDYQMKILELIQDERFCSMAGIFPKN